MAENSTARPNQPIALTRETTLADLVLSGEPKPTFKAWDSLASLKFDREPSGESRVARGVIGIIGEAAAGYIASRRRAA